MIDGQDFWQFSLRNYASHKDVLLKCQDMYGLNVNMLLFCQFLDKSGMVLDNTQFCTIKGKIHHSELELKQLRQVRRQIKQREPEAYNKILEAELLLEQKQQQIIVATLNTLGPCSSGQGNLAAYLKAEQVTLPEKISQALSIAE